MVSEVNFSPIRLLINLELITCDSTKRKHYIATEGRKMVSTIGLLKSRQVTRFVTIYFDFEKKNNSISINVFIYIYKCCKQKYTVTPSRHEPYEHLNRTQSYQLITSTRGRMLASCLIQYMSYMYSLLRISFTNPGTSNKTFKINIR